MLNYNRIAYEIDTLGTPSEQHGGDNPQATQYTNITMLQHFDYPETWSYEGNAGLSDAAKFGKACAHFRDSNSYVRCTNTTGVYNLKAKGNAEAECFVNVGQAASSNMNTVMLEGLLANGGYMYDNHVFKYYSEYRTWAQAKAACEALGGHLATSTSAEKNTFLTTLTTSSVWLGGTDEETEGTWKWITGEEWSYTNWKSGEPNGGSGENYLELNTAGVWNDNNATETLPYICEWDYDIRTSSTILTKLLLWDNGIVKFEGHFLKCVEHDSFTWQQAKEKCESMGGYLASVTSAEKQTLIQSLCNTTYAWLGGQEVNGQWTWLTDETWGYTNWNSGEPSESGDGVGLRKNIDGTWAARKTDINGRSICEWDSLEAAYYGVQGYSFYNGHTFKYYSDTKTWTDAKAFCEELGGHLATSTSTEKQAFIETLTNSNACWLGGQKVSNTWQWITGETWNYTNWNNGEPNDTASDGMATQIYASGKWDDTDVYNSKKFICEWDYDIRERAGSGVSSGNILSLSDNSNVVSTSDAVTQGYKFYNGHTFKYFSDNVLWPEAKAACEALGGHLATSTSAEKNTFLTTVSTNVVWLGAIDENKNDNWEWVTGEEWEYTNWASGDPNNLEEQYLMMNYSEMGKWYDETITHTRAYICEWDYDIREPKQLTLSIGNDGTLNLKSAIWALDETSTLTLEPDTWYHVLLRLSEGTASVYLDGTQALSGNVSGEDITPQSLTLGGYVGYMDEFVFRDGAGTGAPTVPTSAYETGAGLAPTSSNAPVTRVAWSCNNLPEGLTLSSSGVLSGHPTTAGTYNCDVSVATNWGTATKTIKITVSE